MSGVLYLVPTPIGNLEDMTLRALRLLKEVDLILAEDTRTSGNLLKHYDIQTKLVSYHQHNEHNVVERFVNQLESGTNIALITDAGTPAISDPGFLIVRSAIAKGIRVECLPGATAFVPALVVSGLPNDKFVFEGFLPQKKGRQTKLKELTQETRTMIFYESPHRITKTVGQLAEVFGADRQACISREISKLYEQHLRGSLSELFALLQATPIKGEIVLIVAGK